MKTFLRRYGALLLCLVLAVLLGWHVHDTRQRFQQMEDSMWAAFRENKKLEEELSLAETKGLLRDHWVGYGEIDETEKTIALTPVLVPRDYDPETKVSVVCNGETLALAWDRNCSDYRTTLNVPLDESCQVTSVSVTQGEETRQADMAWELMDYRKFTPQFTSGGFYPDYGSGDEDTCPAWGMIDLAQEDMDNFEANVGNNVGTLRKLVDGEIVEETPVKWEDFGAHYEAKPQFSISLIPGQVTEYVLVMTDRRGLTYHYTAFRYQAAEPRADFFQAHQHDISTEVYGPNGTLLYTLVGNGSMPNTQLQ